MAPTSFWRQMAITYQSAPGVRSSGIQEQHNVIDSGMLHDICDPFYLHGFTLIPAWISNYNYYKIWDEITYQFSHFHGTVVEVWEWMDK